jgi:DNA-binding transcriptional LysR family regulator
MRGPRLLDGRLKLRHLLLIDALSDHGSMVRAAKHLHVTQPAVTRGLQELEDILGVPLFERTARGLDPTIFGEAFTLHARDVLAQLRQAGTHIADLAEGGRGSVTIGTHLFGSNMLLPRAVCTFKAEHPASTVLIHHATPDELHVELLAGRLDMIVGRLYPHPEPERVTDRPLYDEPIYLVTSRHHPLQSVPHRGLAELIDQPWVLPVAGTSLRREMEELLVSQGLRLPANRVECTSFLTVRQLLLRADAIGLLPALVAAEDPLLAPLGLPVPSLHRAVGATTAAGRTLSPAAQIMLSHLQDAVDYVDAFDSVGRLPTESGGGT